MMLWLRLLHDTECKVHCGAIAGLALSSGGICVIRLTWVVHCEAIAGLALSCSIMHLILSTLPYYIHTNKDVSISTHAGAHGAGALGGVLAEWRGPVYGRG